jgi:hypothetical protein
VLAGVVGGGYEPSGIMPKSIREIEEHVKKGGRIGNAL